MIDPKVELVTVEFAEVELEGKKYRVAYDLGALAKAETLANEAGANICVLQGVDVSAMSMEVLSIFFVCGLAMAQPELTYAAGMALWKRQPAKALAGIAETVLAAWMKSAGVEDEPEKNEAAETVESAPLAVSEPGSTCGVALDTSSI